MSQLSFAKDNIPFLLGGAGKLSVDVGELQPAAPVPEADAPLFKASFDAEGNHTIALGGENTVELGVRADTALSLVTIFSSTQSAATDLLKRNGLAGFFDNGANANKVVVGFNAGGSAEGSASGTLTYSFLKAGAELTAGADARYTYLRAMDKTLPLAALLAQFFSTMRLPEQARANIEPGEGISLEFGGYIRLAAEASAGYSLTGTKSIALGEMALSEKYDLSILGKVVLRGEVAGRFAITVTAAENLPGWARVRVHRRSSRNVGIAADVRVGVKNSLEGLPQTANEFLGAALGVNARNFLNVFAKARELADFENFKSATDKLAQRFVAEYLGKGFDALAAVPEFNAFLSLVNKTVASYERLGDSAVTLVDRFFDRTPELTAFLQKLQALDTQGLETLRKHLDPTTYNILSQLTGGDPLGFLLNQVTIDGKKVDSLPELRKRAGAVLDLLTSPDHAELRKLVDVAKQSFGIDKFFTELGRVDTADELRAVANTKVGEFVSRLVGRTLDSSASLKQALKEIRAVLDNIDGFKTKAFEAFTQAVNSSYSVALHAEYSRASAADALIDVVINLAKPQGPSLLAAAGQGDFEQALATSDTDVVRLQQGVFTHQTRRESAFNVNIVGWHLNYNYEGFDRVITETEQRLIASDDGMGITVLTTADLKVERQRKRWDEETQVNFLLRALGESAKVVRSDARTTAFMIDSLKSLSARYELHFTDDDTSTAELQDVLAFARDLGLDRQGATMTDLAPLLPRAANGGFGRVEARYDVRFGESGLAALLTISQLTPQAELQIRNAMRSIVLANYLKSDEIHDVAFAYATAAVFTVFSSEGAATFTNRSRREFAVRLQNPSIAAPAGVTLDRTELSVLKTLYNIENAMVKAIKELIAVLHGGKVLEPVEFEDRMGDFGTALKDFDIFDQTSSEHGVGSATIFAMFDLLVRLASGGAPANVSLLRLNSDANGRKVEKLFLSDAAAGASAAAAAGSR